MVRKVVNNNDPGDSTHFGGNDFDYLNNYLLGVDQSATDPVTIATTTQYRNTKFQLLNPASTFAYTHNAGAINSNIGVYYPVLTANDTFVFQNAGQNIYGVDNYPSVKKDGQINVLGNNTANLDGVLTNGAMTATGGSITSVYDTVEGMTLQHTTAATSGNNAGYVSSATGIGVGRTLTNMRFTGRQKPSVTSNIRQYFGFTSNATLPISDTPLGSGDSGIMIGYTSADSTWQVFNNDGSGTAVKTQYTGAITTDTLFHTLDIIVPAGLAGGITVTLDANNPVTVSSRLPATTTNLFFNSVCQSTTTSAISNSIRYIQAAIDR